MLKNVEDRVEILTLELIKTSSDGVKVVITDPFVLRERHYEHE